MTVKEVCFWKRKHYVIAKKQGSLIERTVWVNSAETPWVLRERCRILVRTYWPDNGPKTNRAVIKSKMWIVKKLSGIEMDFCSGQTSVLDLTQFFSEPLVINVCSSWDCEVLLKSFQSIKEKSATWQWCGMAPLLCLFLLLSKTLMTIRTKG